MKYPEFKLESYLSSREFTAAYNLCSSDLEAYSMKEILEMSDERCQKMWNTLSLGYAETEGFLELREEIGKLYGKSIVADNILCFSGAEEGIYCLFHALLEPSDHAIVITPCYQSLETLPKKICATTPVKLNYREKWKLDISRIKEALQPNTKLLVINFPHNPTGACMTKADQQELIRLAEEKGIWIFSDEVYRFLEIDQKERLDPMASLYEKGVSLSVVSKAYGLGGLRVGWIACQNKKALFEMKEIKHYLSICNSTPAEILSLIALKNSEIILQRNRHILLENLKVLDRFFTEKSQWFEWVRPRGGCIGYPLFKGKMPVDKLADNLLREQGILILPGNSIYGDAENHFRISFGRKSMPDAIQRLRRFI